MTQISESFAQSIIRRRGMDLVGIAGNPRPAPPPDGPGFFGGIAAGFKTGTTAQLYRSIVIGSGDYDPDFDITRLDKETREDLNNGLLPEYQLELINAISLDDAYKLKQRLLQVQDAETTLARIGGLTSFGARVAGTMIDPVELLAFTASGGYGVAGKGLGVASRMRAMVRAGVAVGLTSASLEAVAGMDDPNRDTSDVLLAGITGVAFSGPIGLLQRRSLVKFRTAQRTLHTAAINDAKRIEHAALQEAMVAGGKLTLLGDNYFADVVGREANLKRINENLKLIGWSPEALDEIQKKVAAGDIEEILARMDKAADLSFMQQEAINEARAQAINTSRSAVFKNIDLLDEQIAAVKAQAVQDVTDSGVIGTARDKLTELLATPDGKRAITQSRMLQKIKTPINKLNDNEVGLVLSDALDILRKSRPGASTRNLMEEAQAAFDQLAPDIARDRPAALNRLRSVAKRLSERRIQAAKTLRKMGETTGLDNIKQLKRTADTIENMTGKELRSFLDESIARLDGIDDDLVRETRGVLTANQSLENLMVQREKAIADLGAIRDVPEGPTGPTRGLTLEELNAQSQLQARQVLIELGMTEAQAEAHLIGDVTSLTMPPNIVSQFIVRSTTDDGVETIVRFVNKAEAESFSQLQTSRGLASSVTEESVPAAGSGRLANAMAPDSGVALLPKYKPSVPEAPLPVIEPPPAQAGDVDFSNLSPGTQRYTGGRGSIAAKTTRLAGTPEQSPVTHLASQAMFNDPLVRAEGGTSVLGADAAIGSVFRRLAQPFFGEFEAGRSAWLKKKGYFWFNVKRRHEFSEMVTDLVERGIREGDDPDLVRAAKAFIKNQADNLGFAQRHGANPFLRVTQDDLYVPRIWLAGKISTIVEKIEKAGGDGIAEVQNYFIHAVTSGQPGIDPKMAERIGRGMFRLIMNTDDLTDIERHMAIAGQRTDLLAAVMRSEVPDITEEQLKAVLHGVRPRGGKDASVLTNRGRRRTVIDATASYTTPDGTIIRIGDLTERDALRLAELSTRQMAAAGIESKLLREIGGRVGQDFKNFQQMRAVIEKEVLRANGKRASSEAGRLFEIGHRTIRGIPLEPDSAINDVQRSVRGINDILFNGAFGVAAVPETARALFAGGFTNFIKHIPEFGQIVKAVANGTIDNQVIREINVILPMNLNGMGSRLLGRADQSVPILEESLGRGLSSRIEAVARGGSALSNLINFNEPLTMFQKQWSALLMAEKLFSISRGRTVMSKARQSLLGLTDSDAALIMKNLREFAVAVDGPHGSGRVGSLNMHRWDPRAQVMFATALDREARRAVQTVSIGNLMPWMTSEMARTIFQYRTFGFVAYENHLLNSIALRDAQVAVETATEGLLVGLAYVAQTHALAIGRDDRKDFLAERLDPLRIASVVFQRSSITSMAPDAAALVAGAFGFNRFMSDRITGLDRASIGPSGVAFGNPTFRLMDTAFRSSGNLFRTALTNDRFTQGNFQTLSNIAPFNRNVVISNFLHQAGQRLPEKK